MPIQRMGKYILMLEGISKELEKQNIVSENVKLATSIIREYMAKGNTHLELQDIENFPLDICQTGLFIIKENFYLMKIKGKLQRTVFLFEQFIMFAKYHVSLMFYFITF